MPLMLLPLGSLALQLSFLWSSILQTLARMAFPDSKLVFSTQGVHLAPSSSAPPPTPQLWGNSLKVASWDSRRLTLFPICHESLFFMLEFRIQVLWKLLFYLLCLFYKSDFKLEGKSDYYHLLLAEAEVPKFSLFWKLIRMAVSSEKDPFK